MTSNPLIRIGTRGSPLALAQAHEVRDLLAARHPELSTPGTVEVVALKTTGDNVQDRPLSEIGGKGLFTKELDDAMLDGRIDIAVHSMKDVATVLPEGIVLPAILPREDPRDAFMCNHAGSLAELPAGSVVGTASLRRGAQVLHARPDLKVVNLRGNVQTRLRKLNDRVIDATMLAMAGLNRLGMAEMATAPLSTEEMLPAVAQGAVGVACRPDDEKCVAWVSALACAETTLRVGMERAFLFTLDGSCKTPIAGLAELVGPDAVRFRGMIVKTDGSVAHETERRCARADAIQAAIDAAHELLERGGPGFLEI